MIDTSLRPGETHNQRAMRVLAEYEHYRHAQWARETEALHNRLKYSVILVGPVVGAAFLVVLGFLTWVTLAG